MNAKSPAFRILGITAFVAGVLLNLLLLKRLILGHVTNIWGATQILFEFAFDAYVFLAGFRALRRAKGQTSGYWQIGWGRLLLGTYLIFVDTRDYYYPSPNALQPSNPAEAQGMQAAAIAAFLLAVWLLGSGVMVRFKKQSRMQDPPQIASTDRP